MLNPVLFFSKNKKKAFLLGIILSIAVFAMTTIIALDTSVHHAGREMILSPLSEFSIVRWLIPGQEADLEVFEGIESMCHIFEIGLWYTGIRTIYGSALTMGVMSNNESDLLTIFNRSNLTLVSGAFPANENEVVVHEGILTNLDLTHGDTIFGGLVVTGAFQGNARVSFGITDISASSDFLIFPNASGLDNLNLELDRIHGDGWNVQSYSRNLADFEETLSDLLFILFLIITLVAVSISIAIGALVHTMYFNRRDEFAILNVLGYRKSAIRRLIILETAIVSSLSWIIGCLVAFGVLFIIDITIFSNLGQSIRYVSLPAILFTVAVMVFVTICAVLPTMRMLAKNDLVTVIERR